MYIYIYIYIYIYNMSTSEFPLIYTFGMIFGSPSIPPPCSGGPGYIYTLSTQKAHGPHI